MGINLNRLTLLLEKLGRQQRGWILSLQPKYMGLEPLSTAKKSARPENYRTHRPISLVLAVVCLTLSIGHRYYNQPKLDVGTKAPYTIIAPSGKRVVDEKTTAENRRKARLGSLPVLTIDQSVNRQIYNDLHLLLEAGSKIRYLIKDFPVIEQSILSEETQIYLKSLPEKDWETFLTNATALKPDTPPPALSDSSMALAISQLQNYLETASPQEYASLLETLKQRRENYLQAMTLLNSPSLEEFKNPYKNRELLTLSDSEWQRTQEVINKTAERLLAFGIVREVAPEVLREGVRLQLRSEVPASAETVAEELLLVVLRPNLVIDKQRTNASLEKAVLDVKPEIVSIEQGDVIVHAGQIISQKDLVLLDAFNKSQREPNWLGLMGFGLLVGGAVGVLWLVERRFHSGLRRRDYLLLLLLTLSLPVLVALKIPYLSLPAIGLLTGSFYGSAMGITVVGLLSLVLPLGLEIDTISLLASGAGGIIGGLMAGRLRSREEFAFLGCGVAVGQGVVNLLSMIVVSGTGTLWYMLLVFSALQALSGLVWSVVALGLSAYLEHFFDLVTPVRLAELANPNRPLLKRLAAEAPGTFQHTIFVATLAEAAAKALGCNVELVRTGTLYHDVGKMHDPQGFIENQMGRPNKHDQINDPWESALIIKKHVSEGLVMARKHRLPAAIKAFIPEHQGTMSIAYFYHQAQQLAKENPDLIVREEDFRYDGPVPQSRETGIVMLADSCEAALRSLKDASPQEALNMVNKILRARWQDHQLVDSGLEKEDLLLIGEIFVEVWLQVNHKRIAYPKAVFGGK